jgi:hypothetical protein
MICYRDRTYCTQYNDCQFGVGCRRALTPEVMDEARKWWVHKSTGDDVPIAYFTSTPDCFQERTQ